MVHTYNPSDYIDTKKTGWLLSGRRGNGIEIICYGKFLLRSLSSIGVIASLLAITIYQRSIDDHQSKDMSMHRLCDTQLGNDVGTMDSESSSDSKCI